MKKAQAAMEFLMTYGWAILIVLLAIAALAYFGVLNPGRFMSSSCVFNQPGLSCIEFKVDGNTGNITLVMQNGMGQDLNSFNMSIGGDCVGWTAGDGALTDTEKETFIIDCASSITGSKFKEDITVDYLSEEGLSHTITGTLSTRVE